MTMLRNSVLVVIVILEILLISYLAVQITRRKSGFALSVTPLQSVDKTNPSGRLKYYYDLATEATTSVPEWLTEKPAYQRNKDALNDRFDYVAQKATGVFRIITLGDSWTFGMHVSTTQNYSERLEDLLNQTLMDHSIKCSNISKFEVLNLGVGGYDIEYMIERLRLRGMKYDPDLVIPLLKYDDFVFVNEIWQPRIRALMNAYGNNLDAKEIHGVAINPRQEIASEVEREMKEKYKEDDLDQYEAKALSYLESFYKKSVLLFLYGQISPLQRGIVNNFTQETPHVYVLDDVQFLSASEKVSHDEHPNALGHDRFAHLLMQFMIENHIVPCASKH